MGLGWGLVVASKVERGERWTAVESENLATDLHVEDLKGVRGLWVSGKVVAPVAAVDKV